MKKTIHYLKKISQWLLPYHCILCGNLSSRQQDLCQECFNELPVLKHFCQRCAMPLALTESNLICGSCVALAPPFDRTLALYFYETPITKLIMNLKFGETLVNARVFGELLAEKIAVVWYRDLPLPEVIIPVPLHPKRLKERGFNQAVEIARPISKRQNLPMELVNCQRIKHTAPQATLHANQREQNVKSAFTSHKLPYRHVAVLDDVITTGHTITEFCRTLKKVGIKKIDAWCCARPRP